MVCGSRATESGRENLLMPPSLGSSRPMCAEAFPEYHTIPVVSRIRLCGPVCGARSNFLNSPERGSSMPT